MITQSDLIMVGLAFLIGYLDDIYGPHLYHYENQVVMVDRNYQCPTHCDVNHNHHVYFESDSHRMIIDKDSLGKRVKEKKIRKKNKSLTYIDQK